MEKNKDSVHHNPLKTIDLQDVYYAQYLYIDCILFYFYNCSNINIITITKIIKLSYRLQHVAR